MKIALITIHKTNNYGAVLQAYATKVILSKYGEVNTINYKNDFLFKKLNLLRFSLSIKGLKMLVHDLLRIVPRYKAISKFKAFLQYDMNLTEELTSQDLNNGKADDYDLYICGSDQIWNPSIVTPDKKIDPIFFLSFANSKSKKAAYASSLGHHDYSDSERNEVKKLLSDFSMIGIRESDGCKKIAQIMPEKEVVHVLDPTLLLNKEDWLKSLKVDPKLKNREKYILLYTVPRSDLMKSAVEFFSKKLNMRVLTIDQMFFPIADVGEHIKDAGPKEFLELFSNSSFVITDSFHGTCFSTVFEKPFASISAGAISNRLESLLTILDIKERLMCSESDFDKLDLTLDYSQITPKMEKVRQESLDFIARTCN